MIMKEHLQKRKKAGIIDFLEVPINWGRSNKEFIGVDLKSNIFFRIFFDNKYREDKFLPKIEGLEKELLELEKGINDRGIYNTSNEYNIKKEEVDFIKKYNK